MLKNCLVLSFMFAFSLDKKKEMIDSPRIWYIMKRILAQSCKWAEILGPEFDLRPNKQVRKIKWLAKKPYMNNNFVIFCVGNIT